MACMCQPVMVANPALGQLNRENTGREIINHSIMYCGMCALCQAAFQANCSPIFHGTSVVEHTIKENSFPSCHKMDCHDFSLRDILRSCLFIFRRS